MWNKIKISKYAIALFSKLETQLHRVQKIENLATIYYTPYFLVFIF